MLQIFVMYLDLKEKGIQIHGPALCRPPKKDPITSAQKYRQRKKASERNHVEGKFGLGKRGFGLNNIKARLASTSTSWIQALFFVMNLTKLLQVAEKYPGIFVPILKCFRILQKLTQKLFWQPRSLRQIGVRLNLAG